MTTTSWVRMAFITVNQYSSASLQGESHSTIKRKELGDELKMPQRLLKVINIEWYYIYIIYIFTESALCAIAKHWLPEVVETSCSRMYSLYWPVMTQYLKTKCVRLFRRLDQPTEDSGGVSRGRSVAVAVGCLHFKRHFYGTLTALHPHFYGTSTAENCIVAFICIGREIRCLPYTILKNVLFSFKDIKTWFILLPQ